MATNNSMRLRRILNRCFYSIVSIDQDYATTETPSKLHIPREDGVMEKLPLTIS